MNPTDLKSVSFSDISNRTIYQAKRVSSSALSTDITNKNFKSPSPKKPCFFISPVPIIHRTSQNSDHSSSFSYQNSKKRPRNEVSLSENKKIKLSFGPVTKIITELYDPDENISLGFRCFREIEIIKNANIERKIVVNECDDDCPTDDLQIETCADFMSKELESALKNYNN